MSKSIVPLDNIGCLVTTSPTAPSKEVRHLTLGEEIECKYVMTFNRVPYARIADGWVRVNESDGRTPHVELVESDCEHEIVEVLIRIAKALEK
jgi:hypothetical protein